MWLFRSNRINTLSTITLELLKRQILVMCLFRGKGRGKRVQYFIQHHKISILDEMLDRFNRSQNFKTEEKTCCMSQKLCWMKFWSPSNISSNILFSFEHIFDVGYVCPLFHPTFIHQPINMSSNMLDGILDRFASALTR